MFLLKFLIKIDLIVLLETHTKYSRWLQEILQTKS